MDVLLLRFDAPLMSFGATMVDQYGPTDRFPGQSLVAGLCANALGLAHADADSLQRLQDRIEYAARWDVPPDPLIDYHTVDLGQAKMRNPGWTTRGAPEHRAGGPTAAFGTHQRYRHYWANGVMTLAFALLDIDSPDVPTLEGAFRRPARPLFLGRKTCLPAAPILLERTQAPDVLVALKRVPRDRSRGETASLVPGSLMEACWPARLEKESGRQVTVYDRRDWRKQVHIGQHLRREGLLGEEVVA